MSTEVLAAVRAVHIASTVAVAGAFAFRFLVLPMGAGRERRPFDGPALVVLRWIATWCAAALGLALASWMAWLLLTASGMSGMSLAHAFDGGVLGTVLGRTTFGWVWIVRLACMLALAVCLLVARQASGWGAAARADAIAAGLAVVLLVTLAGAGHAVGGSPSERLPHVATDALHLLGAGAWLGALVPLLFVLSRARTTAESAWLALAGVVTRRFSALGVASVLLLLGSGLLNAGWLVGTWSALGDTMYGRLVALKIALFTLLVLIAAANRLWLTPRLGMPSTRHRVVRTLWRNVVVELGVGVFVMAVVGVLGITPPAAHGHGGMTASGNEHTEH